jgi:D-sedoheptulose 7-phosphate isomerase
MAVFLLLKECYLGGGKVLVCGNGGSAADSEHIIGELMKGFILKRRIKQEDRDRIKTMFPEDWQYLSENLQGALPAISLVSQSALAYAYINDVAPDMVFAQQLYGYAKEGDVLIGLSTSGNSKNVVNAIKVAKAFGVKTVGMTGDNGGIMKGICEITIQAPEHETYKIQELHLPVYHALCAMIESGY